MKSGAKSAVFLFAVSLTASCGAQDIKQNYAREGYKTIAPKNMQPDTPQHSMPVKKMETEKEAPMPIVKPDATQQLPIPVIKPQPGVQPK